MGRGFKSLPRYHRDRHFRAGGVGRFFSVPISRLFEDRAVVALQRNLQVAAPGAVGQHDPLDKSVDG